MSVSKKSILTLAAAALLVGCNKHDTISPGGGDEPDTPDTPTAGATYRPATSTSSMDKVTVLELRPAPGQFVQELEGPTHADACRQAQAKLDANLYVSLGSFGGYIVVAFDHSVLNNGSDYDFAVAGNCFDGSNEPGIVWVSQDDNNNGLADDQWYELRGSDYSAETTIKGYSVTYKKPAAEGDKVTWTDNQGASGTVDFGKWPLYITESEYTLTGTRLEPRNYKQGRQWINPPYDGGYVDNAGSDLLADPAASAGDPLYNRFRIADAVDAAGIPVKLKFIDFIKVQTAVLTQSGPLGENSTEVLAFRDL